MSRLIAEHEFDTLVLSSNKPLAIVDFYADWCGPCKVITPMLESIESQRNHLLSVYKINVDEESSLAKLYGVRAIPTIIMFKNGKEVGRVLGAVSEIELNRKIQDALET